MTYIGAEINRHRKRAGLTWKALADQTGLSQQYMSDIRYGRCIPTMATLLRICNAFPDADSAQWAWLLLTSLYGQPMVDLLWRYARREWGAAVDDQEGEGQ